MTREILFKAKRLDNGEVLYADTRVKRNRCISPVGADCNKM